MQSGERDDKDVLHCPACPKTFLCKYGLQSHIETHPEVSSHCALCNLTFKHPQKLRLHRLIAHSENDSENTVSRVEKTEDDPPKVGFDDLTFVDFSVEKFPLIAKHYFEENKRASSSVYLNFMCRLCLKAFPCESSLILHMYSHSKDKCTQCPICDCDYADLNEFHAHMLKHLSDKAFEEIRPSARNEKGDEDITPDQLTKHDFLAMFLLREDEDKTEQSTSDASPKKEPVKPVKMEKKENNEYFAKLGQVYAPRMPPVYPNFPMFPPGQQPTLDDFHRMLQWATNMNMLPSMGVGLLKPGLGNQTSTHTSASKHELNTTTSAPKPAHSNSTMALTSAQKTADALVLSGPEKEINEIKKMNSGVHSCKYCDSVFNDYRSLKSKLL